MPALRQSDFLPARAVAVGAAAIALTLGACTTGGDQLTTSNSTTPSTTTTTASTATESPTTSTSPSPTTGAETLIGAEVSLRTLLYAQAAWTTQPDDAALRQSVFAGDALAAAEGYAKLVSTLSDSDRADAALDAEDSVVLAVSRGADYPRTIVATSTTARSADPVLLLLRADQAGGGYRIIHQSQILPGASVGAFDPLESGTPLDETPNGLAVDPQSLLEAYAAALAYPAPTPAPSATATATTAATPTPAATTTTSTTGSATTTSIDGTPATAGPTGPLFGPDTFANSLRNSVKETATSLGSAVTVTQQHTPLRVLAVAPMAGERGALAFGVLERKDLLTEKTDGTLSTNQAVRVLSGKSSVQTKAELTTLEFVAWTIPLGTGQATTVAAAEQAVAATGS